MVSRRRHRRHDPTGRRDRRGLAVAVAGVLLLLGLASGYRVLLGPGPAGLTGGPFTLVDETGVPRSDASFRGRYMLVFFGYTHCADVCPQTLTEVSEALDRIDPRARRVQPIFITVDPARDTPQRLRAYVAGFSPTLIGLTGTAAQLGAVERQFHVVVEPDPAEGDGDLDHSAVIYLLDPEGRFVAPIPADAGRAVMQATLTRYVGAPPVGRN